jgi:hypothetical protein
MLEEHRFSLLSGRPYLHRRLRCLGRGHRDARISLVLHPGVALRHAAHIAIEETLLRPPCRPPA